MAVPAKKKAAAEAAPPEKACWIRFMAPVTAGTITPLFQCIDQEMKTGTKQVHLMLSSPGGSVFHGLSAHNYLRGLGIKVQTYNFGSVDSIGVVIFCAGEERICVPHARFLIHGVSLTMQGQIHLDEKSLEEHLKSLKIDSENIARVIADTSGQALKKVEGDMLDRTTLNPNQAKDYGLVTKVTKDLYQGGQLYAIYENGQVVQSSQGMQMQNHSLIGPTIASSPSTQRGTTLLRSDC